MNGPQGDEGPDRDGEVDGTRLSLLPGGKSGEDRHAASHCLAHLKASIVLSSPPQTSTRSMLKIFTILKLVLIQSWP